MNHHVLIIDDEENLTFFVRRSLEKEGYVVSVARNLAEARESVHTNHPDLLLLDLNLPDGDGLDLYSELKQKDYAIPCVVITAHGSIQSAIEAIKKGVDDYIAKPFDMSELQLLIKKLLERSQLKIQLNYFRHKAQCNQPQSFFESRHPEMVELQRLARNIAEVPSGTTLIEGPTGSGKEMLARYIHNNSAQADGPFIEINCASLNENLLESELFGYEPGAFTDAKRRKVGLIELAHGGTLFLDEISEMPTSLQAKLLRFIENRSFKRLGGVAEIRVELRIIAATNKDIEQLVRENKFREDLFFRLTLFRLRLPSLKQRREEILLLAQFLLDRIARRLNKNVKHISPQCFELIQSYDWPGNIRELHNVLERAIILSRDDTIRPEHFPKDILSGAISESGFRPALHDLKEHSLKEFLSAMEKELLQQALQQSEGNQIKAARILNEPRHIIRYLMKKHNLTGNDE